MTVSPTVTKEGSLEVHAINLDLEPVEHRNISSVSIEVRSFDSFVPLLWDGAAMGRVRKLVEPIDVTKAL